jgi:hypothetical protein
MIAIPHAVHSPLMGKWIIKAVLILLIIVASMESTLADNDRGGGYQQNRHQNNGRHRGQRYDEDRNWRQHERNASRHWNNPHFEREPGYVYAPPLVYYPPEYQPPGINFIIPLDIH